MTTLLSAILDTELEQEIRYNLNTRKQLGAIIPYLLIVNEPAGTFTVSLLKGVTTVYSRSFTSADIKAALGTTDDNAHVYYPIIPQTPVQIEKGLYKVKLSASGYTRTGSSYVAWNQQFENIQNEMDFEPVTDDENSLAIRYKEHKEGIQ